MSLDKSLKVKNRLVGSRNVLKRDERIAQLKADEKWQDDQTVFGLPKVRVIKTVIGKKKKKKKEGEEEAGGGDDK